MELRLDGFGGDIANFEQYGFKALTHVQVELTPKQLAAKTAAGDRLPAPSPFPWQCLIDTGAQRTHVKRDVVDRLGIRPVAEERVRDFDGRVVMGRVYQVSLNFTSAPGEEVRVGSARTVEVIAGAAERIPHAVVLGMQTLMLCIVNIDGPAGQFTIQMLPG